MTQTSPASMDMLYVGETESISQRLDQHRRNRRGKDISAVVLSISNKSSARFLETNLIRKLKSAGYDIDQDTDSQHSLFGSNPLL